MVVTPFPFTSSKAEAEHLKMPYRVEYTWFYKPDAHLAPSENTGKSEAWVWDRNDGQKLIDYWNRACVNDNGRWNYTLTQVFWVR